MLRFRMFLLALMSSTVMVFAQTAPGQKTKGGFGDPTFILMMAVMFAIVYFLMLRPQQKKAKETQNMLNNLKKGDKVLTIAGIVGIVGNVKDSSVMVKVADSTVLEFKKAAITAVLADDKEEKVQTEEKKK
jgi:preprotein translocase subunit YajC